MRSAGFVLSGGRSTRMGEDKAMLQWQGMALVERVARQVAEAAGSVALVGGAERYLHLGLPLIGESYAGDGPLSGIEAALQLGAEWSLVVACDMPAVTAGALKGLLREAARGECDVVVAAPAGRAPEPLCAVYHKRLLPLVRQLLEHRRLAARGLLTACRTRAVEVEASLVANVNTREEWAAWSR